MTQDYRTLVLPEVRDPAADLAALCVHVEGLQARVEALEEAANDRSFEQAKAIIDKPAPSAAVIGEAFGGGHLAGFISHTADGHPTHALIVAPSALAQPEPVGEREVWEDLKERPWDQYQGDPESPRQSLAAIHPHKSGGIG